MTTHIFKASELPLLERHPATWAFSREAREPRGDSEPAALGRAYHKAMELAATAGRDAIDLKEIAREFNVRLLDLRELWTRLDWDPRGYSAEVPITISRAFGDDTIEIHMVVDLVRLIGENTFEVTELKTGIPTRASDAAEHAQLVCEMLGIHRNYGRDVGLGYVLYVQAGERGWTDCEVRGDEAWQRTEDWIFGICERAIVESRKAAADRECRIGDGCDWCAGRHLCPTFNKPVRDAFAIVEQSADFAPLTAETAARAYTLRRFASAVEERIGKALKAYAEANGPIPLADGRELKLIPKSRMESIDEKHVRAVLRARGVPDDDIRRLIEEINAQRVKTEYMELRPLGKKEKVTS